MATVFAVEGTSEVRVGDRLMISAGSHLLRFAPRFASSGRDPLRGDSNTTQGKPEWPPILCPRESRTFCWNRLSLRSRSGSLRRRTRYRAAGENRGCDGLAGDGGRSQRLGPDRRTLSGRASLLLPVQPACLTAHLTPDRRTAAVIMTHRYALDLDWFRELLPTEVSYLGVLGPRRRWQQMHFDLAAGGIRFRTTIWRASIVRPGWTSAQKRPRRSPWRSSRRSRRSWPAAQEAFC